jgi:septation ring formation regulator EzrA
MKIERSIEIMGRIEFDPSGLSELSDVYQSGFDNKFNLTRGEMQTIIDELKGTREGKEADLANASFDKIKAALDEISERSNRYKGIMARKVEGFHEVTTKTTSNLENRDIRF